MAGMPARDIAFIHGLPLYWPVRSIGTGHFFCGLAIRKAACPSLAPKEQACRLSRKYSRAARTLQANAPHARFFAAAGISHVLTKKPRDTMKQLFAIPANALAACLLLLLAAPAWSQQNKLDPTMEKLENQSVKRLPAGTVFLKSFPADVLGQPQEWVEYSLSLQAGSKYVFTIEDLDTDSGGALVFIYDRSQHKMASNFHNDKIYHAFEFHCQGTGIYKLFIAFKDSPNKKACVAMGKKPD
jgi:hypothetical protein